MELPLSSTDRVVDVQGYTGTGKTTMLERIRYLSGSAGYRVKELAPSASAARTLGQKCGARPCNTTGPVIRESWRAGPRPEVFGNCAQRRPERCW